MFAVLLTMPTYDEVTDGITGSRSVVKFESHDLEEVVAYYFTTLAEYCDEEYDEVGYCVAYNPTGEYYQWLDGVMRVYAPATSPSPEYTMMDYVPF